MPTPKKKRSTARKRKGSIVVRSKAKIIKKGTQTAKNDTLPNAQTPMPRSNSAVFKIKVKKK